MELIIQLHSILRWALLLLAVYAIMKAYVGMKNGNEFSGSDNLAGILFVSCMDVQVLLGLYLYFTSGLGLKNIQNNGMAEVMKNGYSRFFAVEHITGMLIALILIHIGRVKSKKANTESNKHKAAFIWYLIGLILILATIPWPFKKGFEAIGWM